MSAVRGRRIASKAGARISEHRLDNGLIVLLAERHHDPVVAVMVWYRVGSRDEEEREAGVSHFLEHMMFKGTRRFGKGEIDRVTTELGGSNNAFTGPDHTAYWFEFASDRWEKALEIEADRMGHLLLDPGEFEAEKKVVLEELSMGDDDPWRTLSREMQLALFRRHPYRRPVIGFTDSLKALSAADMRDYYERFYRPDNAVLVVSGDFEPAQALAAVRKHFGALLLAPKRAAKTAGRARSSFRPSIDAPTGQQRLEVRWDDEGQRLCMAWPTSAVATDDDWTLDLVSIVLAGGKLSRLFRRLVVEERLATTVSCQNDTRVEGGVFWIFAEAAQGVEPAVLERAIDAEIERLATQDVPSVELARAKRLIVAGEAHDSETVSDIAEDLGEFAVDARWQLALEARDRVTAVTARAVRECVARLLRPERRVIGWCLPKNGVRVKAVRKGAKLPANGPKGVRRVRRS
ncbi:MAG: M16 family metallopeptidase [Planctomycetota bacterium]